MLNSELIDEVLRDADDIPLIAGKFKNYSDDVMKFKPGGGWSVAECFEHLLKIDKKYIPAFEEINKTYSAIGDKAFSSSFMGKFLIKAVHPDAPRKVKTIEAYYPERSSAGTEIVDEYLQQHYIIRGYMEGFKNYDLKKIKVTSPMSPIVKYNLGDASRIIINHDLRHIRQAQRAAEAYFIKLNNEA